MAGSVPNATCHPTCSCFESSADADPQRLKLDIAPFAIPLSGTEQDEDRQRPQGSLHSPRPARTAKSSLPGAVRAPTSSSCHFGDKFAGMSHIRAAPAAGSPLFPPDGGSEEGGR